jgi:PAS domain S-box-containing protein
MGRAENERWHLRKDGSKFFGSGSVTPYLSENGSPQGFVTIMRDLTEQKRKENNVRLMSEIGEDLSR